MSVRNREVIAPTSLPATSSAFSPVGVSTINAGVLAPNEGVKIQYSNDGSIWQDLYLDGILQEIVPLHSLITIDGPGIFRCVKSATIASVGVNLWETEAE